MAGSSFSCRSTTTRPCAPWWPTPRPRDRHRAFPGARRHPRPHASCIVPPVVREEVVRFGHHHDGSCSGSFPKSLQEGPGPNTVRAPHEQPGRPRARKDGSFTIVIGKPRAMSARTRVGAALARRPSPSRRRSRRPGRGRPGKRRASSSRAARTSSCSPAVVVASFAASHAAEVEAQGPRLPCRPWPRGRRP